MASHSPPTLDVVSLFTGAGGLDVGLEAAGFAVRLCVEMEEDARATLRFNRPQWPLAEPGDIHKLAASEILRQSALEPRQVTLLVGGPPCQPFSKAAYWVTGDSPRLLDDRSRTLTAYTRVVDALLPKVLLLENVRGLAFEGKDEAVKLLRQEIEKINKRRGTRYELQFLALNCADYGVPQLRERVFVVASIDGATLALPKPTHVSAEQALTGNLEPYRTAWDAIGHLDIDIWPRELNARGRWAKLLPSIPEGANYLFHTPRSKLGKPLFGWRTRFWSFLLKLAKNRPAWTLQAHPGPATGPFHWRSRRLSTTELALLQTFPEKYQFVGNFRSCVRQIGNAVPCAIGELLGLEIKRQLLGISGTKQLTLIPAARKDCPGPERRRAVPAPFLKQCNEHADHPGTGRGPAAKKRSGAEVDAPQNRPRFSGKRTRQR